MTIIACTKCDWTGRSYEAKKLTPEVMSTLEPGAPTPYGMCPQCRELLPFGATPMIDGIQKTEWRWQDGRAERANLSKYQRDCLLVILARLDPSHPGFQASAEIKVALESSTGSAIPIPDNRAPPFNTLMMAPYMWSWVYPLIVGALYGEVYPGHREYVANDAGQVRAKLEKMF